MLQLYLDLAWSIIYLIEATICYKEEEYGFGVGYSIFAFLFIFLLGCYDYV